MRAHVIVRGRVQGVSYRAWTEREARARGLSGWVRNRSDGTVEAVFEGPADDVRAMIEACRVGPPAAAVTGLDVTPGEGTGERGFEVRPILRG